MAVPCTQTHLGVHQRLPHPLSWPYRFAQKTPGFYQASDCRDTSKDRRRGRAFAAHKAQRCASDAGDPYNLKRCEALPTARRGLALRKRDQLDDR